MGIAGLLPLLKSVQKPTHLSQLAGKTIAVDAYVWLHRGAYACAMELVTGVPTTKYVDYAMHRVRLLQYHNIIPYIVFDGGPLPAKKGTEVERKRKRDESLTLAKTLARQGKHSLAREHYVKCLDITPQMAFQLIKALRAENIQYVVAPYEADAQLFYLEAIGLADGILTEDSDLLIFGTQLLLLKLDPSTAMCTAIAASTLASNSSADLPLHGWGVKELRECAMLSGCDYIEGVRGVGLKTASRYLRKWGTVEKALRALRTDGKSVERDWEARMKKAEVGFLNQRVWDPLKEELVYLTEPDWVTWNEEREKFVGSYIDAKLAGGIARGDIDPVTLKPMIDIMPAFQPTKQPVRSRPLAPKDYNRSDNKDTVKAKGSLFKYFTKQPKPTEPQVPVSPVLPPRPTLQAGRASGKRTLAEQYDRENSTKRPKVSSEIAVETSDQSSKFFLPTPSSSRTSMPIAFDEDGENLKELEDMDGVDEDLETPLERQVDPVQQEEGYLSPAFSSPGRVHANDGSYKHRTPDFSSPLQSRTLTMHPERRKGDFQIISRHEEVGDGVTSAPQMAAFHDEGSLWGSDDRITSPPTGPKGKTKPLEKGNDQRHLSEALAYNAQNAEIPAHDPFTVDLSDIFAGTSGSDVEGVVPSPTTTVEEVPIDCTNSLSDDVIVDDEVAIGMLQRHRVVAAGWQKKFSNTGGREGRGSKAKGDDPGTKTIQSKAKPDRLLRRRETIATPFHPGVPRQASKSLRSKSLTRNCTRTPVHLASSSATPQTGSGPKDPGYALDLSISPSSNPPDNLSSNRMSVSTIQKLQAYRFR